MYLTRMELDISKRRCAMALNAPNMFHGAIEMAFVARSRKLWRIDCLAGRTYLLLVSEDRPDLRAAAEQFGTPLGWESRSYDSFLQTIHNGDRRSFRLTANPVITKSHGSGQHGDVLAHVTYAQQEKWLLARTEKNGFALSEDEFSVTHSQWVSFRKSKEQGRPVKFKMATFEGVLTVTDSDLFRKLLCNGLGREKAYGCGLMTVLRNQI